MAPARRVRQPAGLLASTLRVDALVAADRLADAPTRRRADAPTAADLFLERE